MEQSVILVTGAAGNLGRAVVEAVVARGDHVVALDREEGAIASVLAMAGAADQHLALAGVDLTDAASCERAVRTALDRFGRIDGVAHTVGGFAMAAAAECVPDLWERMYRLNVLTSLNVFRAVIAPMRGTGGGGLVAVGAGAAIKGPAGLSAYAGAKSALHRLVESFADELKEEAIRVNAVLPSIIDTPQNRAAMPDADPAKWVKPAELASVIAFLLSPAASAVTGALIPVTGRM